MMPWENWKSDNDAGGKRELHGEDMDESSDTESTEKGTSLEEKRYIHSIAE